MRKLLLPLALILAAAAPASAQAVAITGGKVVTNTGQGILENATVVISNGRIVSVGTGAAPAGARVIDARGKWVTPGLFAAYAQLGLAEIDGEDAANDTSAGDSVLQASQHAADAFNPDDTAIAVNRIEGVTRMALAVTPGKGLLGGYGALASTSGTFDSVTAREAFMLVTMGDAGASAAGGSRAASWAWLQAAIDDAKGYPGRYANGGEGDVLLRREASAFAPVVAGRIPVMVTAQRASDILAVIALARREPRMKFVILGAVEGWRVAPQLAEARIPVVINPVQNLPDSFELLGATMENAARLQAAGVTIAIADPNEASHNSRWIQQLAGNAVANGLPWQAAFSAITRNPAMIHGRGDLGQLAAGATADVVIWDGDPLELMSSPDAVFIDGRETAMRSRQTELRDRYLNPADPLPPQYRPRN
jgi:imidazolonepropionase-like amidohydrolase